MLIPDKILDICTVYINIDLGYTLVSMFANDETSLCNGKYTIYYVFADREKGTAFKYYNAD